MVSPRPAKSRKLSHRSEFQKFRIFEFVWYAFTNSIAVVAVDDTLYYFSHSDGSKIPNGKSGHRPPKIEFLGSSRLLSSCASRDKDQNMCEKHGKTIRKREMADTRLAYYSKIPNDLYFKTRMAFLGDRNLGEISGSKKVERT